MILIAGPYASGTDGDPERMRRNLERLEEAAWPILAAGHVPMIGEWVALPVMRGAGSRGVGDPVSEQVLYPTAERLLQHCDAVLRLPGASTGADQDVRIARIVTDRPGEYTYEPTTADHGVYTFVVGGEATVDGVTLGAGDSVGAWDRPTLDIATGVGATDLLIVETRM